MPLTFDQLREGMRVHCTINFERITDARVCLAGGERFYLCQNTFAGSSAPSRYEYEYSWWVHSSDTHLFHITHAIARSVPRVLTNDRVRLIRCMQATMDKATENGDAAALIKIITMLRNDHKEHFVSYSQDNPAQVSYAPKPTSRFENKSRRRTTLGRYVRRHLEIGQDQLSDNGLLAVTRCVFGHLVGCDGADITLLEGEEITTAYENAVGKSSCMTGDDAHLVRMYEMNPDKVKLLVLNESEARALLWTCDDGTKVLDRIYPNDGAHTEVIRLWAKEAGIVTRNDNSCPSSMGNCLSDGESHEVTVDHEYVFPYMDTFSFAKINGSTALLSSKPTESCSIRLWETDGGPFHECEKCGFREDSVSWRSNAEQWLCDECYSEQYTTCDRCRSDVAPEDTSTVDGDETWCDDCVNHYASYCEDCSEYFTSTNTCDDGSERCDECSTKCDECGKYYANKEITEGRCPDCRETEEPSEVEAVA